MSQTFLSPADAARSLGVSAKALRLYEERGLLTPGRTAAGWRAYGPADMARAQDITALRALGFSLAQVARVLLKDTTGLEPALASHQAMLELRLGALSQTIARIGSLRATLASGAPAGLGELVGLQPHEPCIAAFDLPWPWGGERFELYGERALTWITGPLGSGKTRLAARLAQELPNAAFVGLDRSAAIADAAHGDRAARMLAWLLEDGATRSEALEAIVGVLAGSGQGALVIDTIEQGLDEASQLALAAWLRRRGTDEPPIFAMTRSSAILDLASARADERIILCPANHSPPVILAPHAGAPGYEAVATCLGPPGVRSRTEGVIAFRPPPA